MTSRRQLLLGVAASLPVAGCLGIADSDSNQDEATAIKTELSQEEAGDTGSGGRSDSSSEGTSDNEPQDTDPLPGFAVQSIELSYYKHLGIYTLLNIENRSDNTDFEIKTQGYDSNGIITETDQEGEIPTSLEYPMELQNDDIWALRNNIGSLTSFVIKGRIPDGEFGVVKAFTGDEFRERVGVEADGFEDPDVAVESEPSEEETNQQPEIEQTESSQTTEESGSASDTGEDTDSLGEALDN